MTVTNSDEGAVRRSELERALSLIDDASGGAAEGSVSIRHDLMDAIEETLAAGNFDEIIVSTVPHHTARWLHIDLPHRVTHLGLPVTMIVADALA